MLRSACSSIQIARLIKVLLFVTLLVFTLWNTPQARLQTKRAAGGAGEQAGPLGPPTLSPTSQIRVESGSEPARGQRKTDALAAITPAGAPLITPRREHTATLLADGRVLVAGGRRTDTIVLASAEIYDPNTGGWSDAGALNQPRYLHAAVLLQNGKVLVAGGGGGNNILKSAEIYDPAQNQWSNVSPMSEARYRHTLSLLPDGTALAVGGENSQGVTRKTEIFNGTQWILTAELRTGRREHAAVVLASGQVLVAGGRTNLFHLITAEIYHPVKRNWRATGSMTTARRLHTLTMLTNGEVLAAGGFDGGGATNRSETFNLHTERWTRTTGDLNHGRYAHSATLLPNGRVFIAGGLGAQALASAEVYDPATRRWTPTGSLAEARANHTATMLPSGRALLAGGDNGANPALSSAELFELVSASWTVTRNANNVQTQMQAARFGHTATLLVNGQALIVGGIGVSNNSFVSLDSAELYDPRDKATTLATFMDEPRQNHTATLLPNGWVLVAGGYKFVSGAEVYLNTAEVFDPINKFWIKTGNNLSQARAFHTATLLRDGRVLVTGGRSLNNVHFNGDLYDPATNRWTPLTRTLSAPRREHTAALLPNGKVLLAGGRILDDQIHPTADLYDPVTGQVALARGTMSSSRYHHTATLLPSGRVLVAGGLAFPGFSLRSADLYDPAADNWTPAQPLADARYLHTATLLPNGKVLITGGASAQFLDRCELYDPASGAWAPTDKLESGARAFHTATLLLDGQVLTAGGLRNSSTVVRSYELYDPGLGFEETARPEVNNAIWYSGVSSVEIDVSGIRFQGLSEAAGGGAQSSPSNHPVVQIRSLGNEQMRFLPVDTGLNQAWTNTSFVSRPVPGFPAGYAALTVFTNGIPGRAHTVKLGGGETAAEFASVRGRITDRYGLPFQATLLLDAIVGESRFRFGTVQTDANGFYSFTNLPVRTTFCNVISYQVTVQPQSGVTFTPPQSPVFTANRGNCSPPPGLLPEEQQQGNNRFVFNSVASGAVFNLGGRLSCSGACTGNCLAVTVQSPVLTDCTDCTVNRTCNDTYLFAQLSGNESYTVTVADSTRVYSFNPDSRMLTLNGSVSNLDFNGQAGNPRPRLTSMAPDAIRAGGDTFPLIINGSDFVDGARVYWGSVAKETSVINSSQLRAEILAGDIAAPGAVTITVTNPTPGGGGSLNSLNFNVNSAGYDLALAKSHSGAFLAGSKGVYTLTVSNAGPEATAGSITVSDPLPPGLSYVSGTGPGWGCGAAGQNVTCSNSNPLAPNATSAITLTVGVSSAAAPGVTNTATVTSANDTNPGNNSASDPTTVMVAPATLTNLSQDSALAGSAGFTLTVTGTNFIAGSKLRWQGSERTTNLASATQLTAEITTADLATAGTFNVDVVNAPSSPSNALPFTVIQPYEADVAPRPPGGNGAVTVIDWTLIGRYAAGLDTPPVGGEFQRADCAPRLASDGVTLMLGDGKLTVTDWVLAGLYASGNTPLTLPGGPTAPTPPTSFSPASFGPEMFRRLNAANPRTLRLMADNGARGAIRSVVIELDALGDENALGFSLLFDPARWRALSSMPGPAAAEAAFIVNDTQAASGRIGIALALPAGHTLGAGRRQIATITFASLSDDGDNPGIIGFADEPVAREVADAGANLLPAAYSAQPLAVVSAASFSPSALAGESIAAAFGDGLSAATLTAETLPLPTQLGDTRVVACDRLGVERAAPLFFVSPTQVNFLIPAGTAPGVATVTITNGRGQTAHGLVEIVTAAPALFTVEANDRSLAAGVVMRIGGDGATSFDPIARFDRQLNRFVAAPIDPERDPAEQILLILFGTGIRQGAEQTAASVMIGGERVEVSYAGPQGGLAGLDQVNVRLSRDLSLRGEVEIRVHAAGRVSNPVRVTFNPSGLRFPEE
jgi:uncharacterized protein (TIGR03437 family)